MAAIPREQAYFADGITEDLTTELSRFQELRVIARNSVLIYKTKPVCVQEVGCDLGVHAQPRSVRKAGGRVRITAQLVDAGTGHHLWADETDRDLADIFAVQDEVTGRIVATLAGKLAESERLPARSGQTGESGGLRLRAACRELGTASRPRPIARRAVMYEKAIELDPDYARVRQPRLDLSGGAQRTLGECRGPAARACPRDRAPGCVMVNPASHSNHLALGQVCLSKGLHDEALEALETAITLNPNDADGYVFLAQTLSYAGRPTRRSTWSRRLSVSIPLTRAGTRGTWDGVLSPGATTTPSPPCAEAARRRHGVHRWLAVAYAQLGREQEAKAAAEEYLRRTPDFSLARHLELMPFQHAEDRDHYAEGLRKAGLPEDAARDLCGGAPAVLECKLLRLTGSLTADAEVVARTTASPTSSATPPPAALQGHC